MLVAVKGSLFECFTAHLELKGKIQGENPGFFFAQGRYYGNAFKRQSEMVQ